jgi:hypothetical protein
VIVGERRCITGGKPVFSNADAKTTQAANDRPAGARRERCGGDAGFLAQRIAKLRIGLSHELGSG